MGHVVRGVDVEWFFNLDEESTGFHLLLLGFGVLVVANDGREDTNNFGLADFDIRRDGAE